MTAPNWNENALLILKTLDAHSESLKSMHNKLDRIRPAYFKASVCGGVAGAASAFLLSVIPNKAALLKLIISVIM